MNGITTQSLRGTEESSVPPSTRLRANGHCIGIVEEIPFMLSLSKREERFSAHYQGEKMQNTEHLPTEKPEGP